MFSFTFSLHTWSKLHIASLMVWNTPLRWIMLDIFLFNALDFVHCTLFLFLSICSCMNMWMFSSESHIFSEETMEINVQTQQKLQDVSKEYFSQTQQFCHSLFAAVLRWFLSLKVNHTGLDGHEGEQMMTELSFLAELSLWMNIS